MPEGHTLHRLAAELSGCFAGDVVRASSPQGRFADGARLLDNRRLTAAESWGKHLFCHFDGERVLHVHLGLYGTFVASPAPGAQPRGAVRLRLASSRAVADLRGPTACSVLTGQERQALVSRLGPDPLRGDADSARGWQIVRSSRRSLASLLMDQAVISGIGNVYRAELLFRHRLDPGAPGSGLTFGVWQDLWDDLVILMRHGVLAGHIDTVRPQHVSSGEEDRPHVYVYRRTGQPCFVCGTRVRTRVVEGRNLYWCPTCQRRRGARRLGSPRASGSTA